jgi:hypothetical protein
MFQNIIEYLQQGFLHVFPLGFDHILFITSLFFLAPNLKSLVIQSSVFTLAHCLTLFLNSCYIIISNSNYIEPLIALSIVFTSLENIFKKDVSKWRLFTIFCFGLIHGMGFANALHDLGISENHFTESLICFNVGVEIAQLFILVLLYFGIAFFFKNKIWYKQRIVYPISSIIACIAMYWFVQRIL